MPLKKMKLYIDTHDQRSGTFPAGISKQDFAAFFAKYEQACRDEGMVVLRAHVSLQDGRDYCFSMAPSAEHVHRAHAAAGLGFESITEVMTLTPGDLFLEPPV
jgi:hypothetical protein